MVTVAARHPHGVVFDCDGTLADTESLSKIAWREQLDEVGYTPTVEDFLHITGHPFPHNWAYFSGKVDLGDQQRFRTRLRQRYVELTDAGLPLYDDAIATLRQLVDNGTPVAVASSSSREHVLRVLEQADIATLVRAVVAFGDTERAKPHPDPYLAAARYLNGDPSLCAAVEDTPVGVASAVSAGLFTVAVVRRATDPATLAAAHRVVSQLTVAVLSRPA